MFCAVDDAHDGRAAVIAAYADAERVPGGPLPPAALVAAARSAGVGCCLLAPRSSCRAAALRA
jgi:hypothetical protein